MKFGFPSAPSSGHLRARLVLPDTECPPQFFLQRNSVPNIHTSHPTPAPGHQPFKKRHSFQEGVKYFQDKVRGDIVCVEYNDRSVLQFPNLSLGSSHQSDSFSDFTWANRDHLNTGGLDWSLCQAAREAAREVFVSENSQDTAEDDELSAGLENLCKAVTEQALD